MRFMHISDLHLGKRLREVSLLDDQKYILDEILSIVDREKTDGVIIAGDVYDKAVPSAESIRLFDDFISRLVEKNQHIFIISGNHDSAERIAYGSKIFDKSGVHISPVYDGDITPVTLKDKFGTVNVFMLPFLKPVNIKACFPDEELSSYTDAINCAVSHMQINDAQRNILITHQFVTGSVRSDSEVISVGGAGNVDTKVFEKFDYVALGHLHRPQSCSSENIRYCGSPLKYSFSEADDEKSVTIVELKKKGINDIKSINLKPLHDMVNIRGSYEEITCRSFYEKTTWRSDYVRITLTDEEDIPGVGDKLRTIYSNWLQILYDNKRTKLNNEIISLDSEIQASPLELFSNFYELQNNSPMSRLQSDYMSEIISQAWEEK